MWAALCQCKVLAIHSRAPLCHAPSTPGSSRCHPTLALHPDLLLCFPKDILPSLWLLLDEGGKGRSGFSCWSTKEPGAGLHLLWGCAQLRAAAGNREKQREHRTAAALWRCVLRGQSLGCVCRVGDIQQGPVHPWLCPMAACWLC